MESPVLDPRPAVAGSDHCMAAIERELPKLSLLVQKFGGTSVADSDKILAAARRAIQAHNRGKQVIVVVSARGTRPTS